MITLKNLHRRTFLRGVLQGSAVAVALPLLDVFLDPHGEALATGTTPVGSSHMSDGLPTVFGTWYWRIFWNSRNGFPVNHGECRRERRSRKLELAGAKHRHESRRNIPVDAVH